MSRLGIEPRSLQPQCRILTTVRSRPISVMQARSYKRAYTQTKYNSNQNNDSYFIPFSSIHSNLFIISSFHAKYYYITIDFEIKQKYITCYYSMYRNDSPKLIHNQNHTAPSFNTLTTYSCKDKLNKHKKS